MNPEHNDKSPSAGINTNSGIHHCFSCGYNKMVVDSDNTDPNAIWSARYANLKKGIVEVSDIQHALDSAAEHKGMVVMPPVDHYVTEEWRGITAELPVALGVYYCSVGKYRGRYVFPIGTQGFDARIVDASANMVGAKWIRPKGMNVKDVAYPIRYLIDHNFDLSHIIICEGVLDAVSYIQLGYPAIASFGLTPPSMKRITTLLAVGVQKVTLAMDNDKAGLEGALALYPYYSEWFEICSHPIVEAIRRSGQKDANDYLNSI